MGVVAEAQPNYNPLLAQQALAFISMKNGQPIPQNIVPPVVEQSLREFARAWTSKNPSLIEPHRRTLYYYLCRKTKLPILINIVYDEIQDTLLADIPDSSGMRQQAG